MRMKHLNFSVQKGSALLISLGILTAITLGAMVAMQRSSVQIRMVSNLQHQHEVKNAALSNLNSVYTQMLLNGSLQNKILIETKALYTSALDADPAIKTAPLVKVYEEYPDDLKAPVISAKSLDKVVVTARHLPAPAESSHYLKAVQGCGSSCSAMHLAVSAEATAKNGATKSSQEIGLRRIVPGVGN